LRYTPVLRYTLMLSAVLPLLAILAPLDVQAFQFVDGDRWSRTATDDGTLKQGQPTTLTWGIIPDGTGISGGHGEDPSPSDLIAMMDGFYGSGGGDLTQRPWFALFADPLERWEEVSGLSYVYEPNDPGTTLNGNNPPFGTRGSLGSVPDVRIGGHSIVVQGADNILAYNYFPDSSDMVIDTDDTSFYGSTTNNSRALRNVVMHEAGHGIGLSHVDSNDSAILMESFLNLSFDGPQLDDILAAHRAYGDAWEKNGGNDTSGSATPLGLLASGSPLSIGADAIDTAVAASDIDFISIDDNGDTDFLSFTTSAAGLLDVTLTPRGPTYNEGPQGGSQSPFDTSAQSDLTLTLFDTDGSTSLATINVNPAGGTETLVDFDLGQVGTYFVRVTGSANSAQLYELDLSIVVPFVLVLGDMNGDAVVDGVDVPLFMQALVNRGAYDAIGFPIDADISGDLDGSGTFDLGDLGLLSGLIGGSAAASAAPEPSSWVLILLAAAGVVASLRRR